MTLGHCFKSRRIQDIPDGNDYELRPFQSQAVGTKYMSGAMLNNEDAMDTMWINS